MAAPVLIPVIYNMITRRMKSNPTENADAPSARITRRQWFMTVVGILIAITCSLVLLSENNTKGHPLESGAGNAPAALIIDETVNLPSVFAQFSTLKIAEI